MKDENYNLEEEDFTIEDYFTDDYDLASNEILTIYDDDGEIVTFVVGWDKIVKYIHNEEKNRS